jgi:hypothetical protein
MPDSVFVENRRAAGLGTAVFASPAGKMSEIRSGVKNPG